MKIFGVVTTTLGTFIAILMFIDSRVDEKLENLEAKLAPVVTDVSAIKESIAHLEQVFFPQNRRTAELDESESYTAPTYDFTDYDIKDDRDTMR